MSFLSTLRQWDQAVACVDQGDVKTALDIFLDIEEKNSKISFNIGCLYLADNNFEAAEKAFDCSIGKDEHLAVAFFQRGITFLKKENFEEALADFSNASRELRGNNLIDYKLLGLRYKLYASEVLHNMALAQAQLGEWNKAQESLLSALNLKPKFRHVDLALEAILKQKLFDLVKMQPGLMFKPKKHHVNAELEQKHYLGKAKVVASVVHKDEFSGFAPLQPQTDDAPTTRKAPEVLRALKGEPHTVLYEFSPETSGELAVLPGNIVFVLNKGDDNWASVIFNERRGLVPYNYLEPLDITGSSKQGQNGTLSGGDEIPAPPFKEPPARPIRHAALSDSPNSVSNEAERSEESPGCIVKVHFLYTVVITAMPGDPYEAMLEKIRNKLNLPASALSLSYVRSGERVTIGESDMTTVWHCMRKGHLTLWCAQSEDPKENPPKIHQALALYSYEASSSEDLEFCQGDVITVLSKVNADWFEGQCKGKIGIFPASFVQSLHKD
ncbi:neutrophil cytosol factor 2 [Clupea harengus]|uniref:Neutrophil cytosol factor 2 n=1 Tax=Clupea harengus TaxID=7950 RepID=A0A6P3VGA8_CLUHA|nr:neutrophil cytosol factor 2 [Clupea harengus]